MIELVVKDFKERGEFAEEAGAWVESMLEKYPHQYLPITMLLVYFVVSHIEKVMAETPDLDVDTGRMVLGGVLADAMLVGQHFKGSTEYDHQLEDLLGRLGVALPPRDHDALGGSGAGGSTVGTDGTTRGGRDTTRHSLGTRILDLFRPRRP